MTQVKASRTNPPVNKRLLLGLIPVILIGGALGLYQIGRHDAQLNASLGQTFPELFPSPTPTATSTPTTAQRVAAFLAQADAAWQQQDLENALVPLKAAHALQPSDPQVIARLSVAHAAHGLRLIETGQVEKAVPALKASLALHPDEPTVAQALEMAQTYLAAQDYLERTEVEAAIPLLETLYQTNAYYQNTRQILAQAHFDHGLSLQEQGALWDAKAAYERALQLEPDDRLAKAQLYEVDYLLATPTPTATSTPTITPTPTATPIPEKKIVVDVSAQTLWAYENDEVRYEFVCSTGQPGSPTRRGTFQVLDKIDNAWGGAWNIWMPYWLGIYWAGGSENGIHALPVSLDGSVLWSGYLGTPISYGCIVLDTWAAAIIYDWADVGTPVIIRD